MSVLPAMVQVAANDTGFPAAEVPDTENTMPPRTCSAREPIAVTMVAARAARRHQNTAGFKGAHGSRQGHGATAVVPREEPKSPATRPPRPQKAVASTARPDGHRHRDASPVLFVKEWCPSNPAKTIRFTAAAFMVRGWSRSVPSCGARRKFQRVLHRKIAANQQVGPVLHGHCFPASRSDEFIGVGAEVSERHLLATTNRQSPSDDELFDFALSRSRAQRRPARAKGFATL